MAISWLHYLAGNDIPNRHHHTSLCGVELQYTDNSNIDLSAPATFTNKNESNILFEVCVVCVSILKSVNIELYEVLKLCRCVCA